jgi:hypothetical protein
MGTPSSETVMTRYSEGRDKGKGHPVICHWRILGRRGASCGGWATPRLGRFNHGKEAGYPLNGHQGRSGRLWKISHPLRFEPWTVQRMASRYTDFPYVRSQKTWMFSSITVRTSNHRKFSLQISKKNLSYRSRKLTLDINPHACIRQVSCSNPCRSID